MEEPIGKRHVAGKLSAWDLLAMVTWPVWMGSNIANQFVDSRTPLHR